MRVKTLPMWLAGALLVASLAVGFTHTTRAVPHTRAAIQRAIHAPQVGHRSLDLNSEVARFRDFVAAIVPAHARMRVVLPVQAASGEPPVAASCDPRNRGPAYWWFVYLLAPRASVCDDDARWTVYLGVAPPTGGVVYRFAPTYAVVRR